MCYAFILAKENLMAQGWETWKPSGCVENHYALHFCSWSIKMCLSFKSLHLFRSHQSQQVSRDFLLPDFLCVPMSNEELGLIVVSMSQSMERNTIWEHIKNCHGLTVGSIAQGPLVQTELGHIILLDELGELWFLCGPGAVGNVFLSHTHKEES